MNKKNIFIILLFLMMGFLVISSVNVEDSNLTDESTNDELSIDEDLNFDSNNDEDVLNEQEESTLGESYQWFSEIQEKIDNANEGDTIELSGTYYGVSPIFINKTVKIVGTGNETILHANINTNVKDSVFYIYNVNSVVIDNLTLIGGCNKWVELFSIIFQIIRL